ncbi:MAG: Viral A-type inclusion protein repeat containing protein [candidate division TM6 bacterium GW2011_GWF2_43_17]|nr:MAG: Viral A-type inclusion protein repeat containing protein [candidate division TM6 bacterium GW2011_GWF2_43_17]
MKSIKKISLFIAVIVSGPGFLHAINTRLFPEPQRGIDLNTAGILLRESMKKNDVSATRQVLATLRYLLDVSWEELLRRLADGELNSDFKIVEGVANKKELQRKFYDVTNVAASKVSGSLAQAEMLKKQIESLERQVAKKEDLVVRLERQMDAIRAQAQARQQELSDDASRDLQEARRLIGLREDAIRRLEQEKLNIEGALQVDLADVQAQVAKDMWEVRKLIINLEQQNKQIQVERDNAQQEMLSLQGRINSLAFDLALAKRRGGLSEQEVQKLEAAKNQLQQVFDRQALDLQQKENDFQAAQQQINNQQQTLRLLNTGNLLLVDEKARLQVEKQELEERLRLRDDALIDAAQELDEKIKSLEDDLKAQQEDFGKKEGNLLQENLKYFQQIRSLGDELADQQTALGEFEKTLQEARDANLLSKQEVESQKKAIEGKIRGLRRQGQKIKELEGNLEKTLDENERFKRLNGELKTQLKQAKRDIDRLEKEKAKVASLLKDARDLLKKERQEKEKTMREKLQQRVSFLAQLFDAKNTLEELQEKSEKALKDSKEEIKKLEEANESLKEDNEEAKKLYDEELKKRQDELGALQKNFDDAREDIKNLTIAGKQLEKENKRLRGTGFREQFKKRAGKSCSGKNKCD